MYAQHTVNACFWVSLAAALAKSAWQPASRYRGGLSGFQAAQEAPLPFDINNVRNSEIAAFAVQLRMHMCDGSDAVLHQLGIRDKIYQAFAALGGQGRARTLQSYERWVAKLAQDEFADELVVLATSMELSVRIVCVPYTPLGSAPWQISQYPPEGRGIASNITVYLGNDDVHYVWLDPTAA